MKYASTLLSITGEVNWRNLEFTILEETKFTGKFIPAKMREGFRILYLLMLKNLIVRKRRWITSIVELLLPGCIIALILTLRSLTNFNVTSTFDNATHYPVFNEAHLMDQIPSYFLRLHYTPQNNFTNQLMRSVLGCRDLSEDSLYGFDTEDEMLLNYETIQGNNSWSWVYAFDFSNTDGDSVPKKLQYRIRGRNVVPYSLFDQIQGPNQIANWLVTMFPIAAFQTCLDNAFIDRVANSSGVTKPTVVIQMMPYPPYEEVDIIETVFQSVFLSLGGLIFIATIYLIATYVSAEKTSGVNTLLKINGIKPYQNFLSWLVTGMLFGIIPVSSVTAMLKIDLFNQTPFYYSSNWFIIWLAIFISFLQGYAYCVHVASYFSKAWLAQLVALIIPVVMINVLPVIENTTIFVVVPYLGLLFPAVATMRIFDELNKRESDLTGAHWSNLFETANSGLNTTGSLGFIMLFSILGTFLHLIFAVYFEAVLPNKYSVQKHPLFFLKYSKRQERSGDDTRSLGGQPKLLEPVADGSLTPGIRLIDLAKSFTSGYFRAKTVEAVRGITLDFYKGQITALLGHNGAGKTTTFSILTGLTAPSAGTVYVNGKNIATDLDEIRSDLGLCPQENIMFADLTVLEQLRLIGLLKQRDKTWQQVTQDVDNLLNKLNIIAKRNVIPATLSGGQKRRLCLGMALIGNASTLFLDEPTSGMDPETRRGTWDIILKYRQQKTIIITTHSMEEADVLGDRIAIMHSGKMKCYGTSMFLKKFYGHNYYDLMLSTTPHCDVEKIRGIVGSEAKINIDHHGKMIINISFTSSLPEILDNMYTRKVELGLTGISVSMITLEQVFLKAAGEEETNDQPVDDVNETVPLRRIHKYLTGSELTRQKITALLTKKVTHLRTNKGQFVLMICLALFAVAVPALLNTIGLSTGTRTMSINLGLYENSEVLISSANQILGQTYKEIVEEQGGTGTVVNTNSSLSDELLARAKNDLADYRSRLIISGEFNESLSANGFYNGDATLSALITINAMSNLVLRTVASEEYSIESSIGDLPQTLRAAVTQVLSTRLMIISYYAIFFTLFFYIVALLVKDPLLEKSVNVKQLQRMAGVSPNLYWGTMFVIDYAVYFILTVIILVAIFVSDVIAGSSVMDSTEVGIFFLLFLLFGINVLILIYVCSFIKKPFYTVYSMLGGLPVFIAYLILLLNEFLPNVKNGKTPNLVLRRIFSFEPHVSFTFAYVKLLEVAADNSRCRGFSDAMNAAACAADDICCDMNCSNGHCENPLPYFSNFSDKGGLEEFVLYLLFTPIILFLVLAMLENQVFGKLLSKYQINQQKFTGHDRVMDSEVETEKNIVRKAINQNTSKPNCDDENVFLAFELSKCYGKLVAVKEVNFRVKRNECFGLLGVNGAGKSTTFRMLVGEEVPNSGVLYRDSYSIKSDRTEYLAGMGYCPQNNALIPGFNAVDHLTLFARLRGIPESEVTSEVDSWIDKLRLNEYAKNPSETYSGGNKRRLNIAMALIAAPRMVLLDEPTSGVDPAARRLVWNVLQNCQASGQSIILTSHSMEECEALCNRLVIMVQGRLLCVGASQELKERFGAGFNLTIKMNPERSNNDFMSVKIKVQSAFTCELKDEHPGYLFYHISDSRTSWVQMFGTMENLKSEYRCIEDFTVSTSTLEQLFIQFARSAVFRLN